MIKLIKNELYKIFNRKFIYIVFLIGILFATISASTNMIIEKADLLVENEGKSVYESIVTDLESQGDTSSESYISAKVSLEVYKLYDEYSVTSTSPERYYISTTIYPLLNDYYNLKMYPTSEEYLEAEARLNDAKAELKNYDWRKPILEQIEEVKAHRDEPTFVCHDQMDSYTEINNAYIDLLQYRLDHNVPFSFSNASEELETYWDAYYEYYMMDKDDASYKKYDDLYDKREKEEFVNETKYKIDHGMITEDASVGASAGYTFVQSMSSVSTVIIVLIVLLVSNSIAEEFNKGTIKQLLVKPYSRKKILISKMISVFIATFIFTIIIAIYEAVLTGIIYHSLPTLFDNNIIYSFNTRQVFELNYILDGFLGYLTVIPEEILIILFATLVSIISTSGSLTVILGIILPLGSSVISLLIGKLKFLAYIPFCVWDFDTYLFGGIARYQHVTLLKSSISVIVFAILLYLLSIIFFEKKDIKNQ